MMIWVDAISRHCRGSHNETPPQVGPDRCWAGLDPSLSWRGAWAFEPAWRTVFTRPTSGSTYSPVSSPCPNGIQIHPPSLIVPFSGFRCNDPHHERHNIRAEGWSRGGDGADENAAALWHAGLVAMRLPSSFIGGVPTIRGVLAPAFSSSRPSSGQEAAHPEQRYRMWLEGWIIRHLVVTGTGIGQT